MIYTIDDIVTNDDVLNVLTLPEQDENVHKIVLKNNSKNIVDYFTPRNRKERRHGRNDFKKGRRF
jgi:hypothetical protein